MFNVPEGGEAIIIKSKDKAILIDGGGGDGTTNVELGKAIRKFLTHRCAPARGSLRFPRLSLRSGNRKRARPGPRWTRALLRRTLCPDPLPPV